jgi:hypothetical protein
MRDKKGKAKEKKEVRDEKMRNLKCFLPLVVVITAVLLAFSNSVSADYSGDHPLTIYDHDTINGGLVFETITDGSGYTDLNAIGSATYSQDITINIPAGATVKMARLYNTYCWSKSNFGISTDPGAPAEAELTFSNASTTQTRTCQHTYFNWMTAPNPIVYPDGVIHYWDTKNLTKYGGQYDYPSGEFAWDVTDMVTSSGTYTAKIANKDSTATPNEYFTTFGFGLLVVYEKPIAPEIEYWVAEGCDALMARTFETPENATTSATFGGISGATDANLTTVLTCSQEGTATPPLNMLIFNGEEIGPSTAVSDEAYGVNHFDVTAKLNSVQNVLEFQDRDDCEYVHNAFLVAEYKPDLKVTKKSETWVSKEDKTYTVTYTVKNIGGASAGASTTSIEIDGTEKAPDAVPELAAGASYMKTLGPFTMSGDSDTIRVCADKDKVVSESDEENNCKENVFEMPTSTTKTIPAGENGTVEGPAGSDTTVNVSASGDVNVTVEYYSDNPHPGATKPDNMVSKYIDISVDNAGNVSWPMYVEMHYTNGEIAGMDESTLGLYHYKAGAWHRCSNTGVNVDENYVWAYVEREECSGSPFASGGPTPPVPVPEYNVAGLIALIAVLSVVLAAVMGKRRSG